MFDKEGVCAICDKCYIGTAEPFENFYQLTDKCGEDLCLGCVTELLNEKAPGDMLSIQVIQYDESGNRFPKII